MASNNIRFHYLDGFRAIAIFLVVFHHSFTATIAKFLINRSYQFIGDFIFHTGASGVELFFILSGVVLLRPYLRSQRKLELKKYYIRRFQRIYPPFFIAWLFTGLVVTLATFIPTWYSRENLPTISLSTWLPQLPIVNFTGIYYNAAWWSLSIEIIFYITVPIFINLIASKKVSKIYMLAIIFVSVILSIVAYYFRFNQYGISQLSYFNLLLLPFLTYLPCFLCGIAIAKFDFDRYLGFASMGLGIAYLALSLRFPALNIHNSYALLYAGLVSNCFANHNYQLKSWLSAPILVWLGERSYSVFLIHFTVFYLVNYLVSFLTTERNPFYFILTRSVGLPLALLASMLLFHFVERLFARNLATANSFWPTSKSFNLD